MTEISTDRDAVKKVVAGINDSWLAKRYDDIGRYLLDDAVVAPPGSPERIRGCDAYVESYRQYDSAATTHEFTSEEPQIDVVGDVAVSVCPFRIVYEMQGTTYRERGTDLLVLVRSRGEWRVAWRSLRGEPAE
jgi:ketosteroid isomerase-like protein